MGIITPSLLGKLTQPGPRLPWLAGWLAEEVWSEANYRTKPPKQYLQDGEQVVNELEEVIAAAARRVYDEFTQPVAAERNLRSFLLSGQRCGAVVFDGLSLREVPLVKSLALQSGLRIVEEGWTTAALPSETMDFVGQRLGVPGVSPSQLPASTALRDANVACCYLEEVNQRRRLDSSKPSILIWSSFPDYRYSERDAKFAEMFENLHSMMMTAWQNSVQEICRAAPGRRILVTSDHGYVFFGPGCSFAWNDTALAPLNDYFGGSRYARLDARPNPPENRGIAVMPDRGIAMIRGRPQTHPRGDSARKLYKHGGLSLMEMLVPWIVLEAAS